MSAYLRSTHAAASAIYGARVVSLAGGCYGVESRFDGGAVILARDPELGAGAWSGTWAAWLVDQDGEHTSDTVDIGFVRPRDYAHVVPLALRRIRDAREAAEVLP